MQFVFLMKPEIRLWCFLGIFGTDLRKFIFYFLCGMDFVSMRCVKLIWMIQNVSGDGVYYAQNLVNDISYDILPSVVMQTFAGINPLCA